MPKPHDSTPHPAIASLPAGARIVMPFDTHETMTWGDFREYVAMASHLADDDPIQWDWTEHHETNGAVTEPSGIVYWGEA